jgi:lipid-binding SYLF domain-containing protein
MKRLLTGIVVGGLLTFGATLPLTAADTDLKAEAESAIEVFKKTDSSLKKFFDESAGFAIFPSVGKGGLVFGGEHGNGLAYEKGKVVGEVTLSEINFGAQIGGGAYYEVIFFETAQNMEDLKASKTRLSAKVSAVAAADGAAKTAKYDQGIVVFTLPRGGLMAQATVGGQKLKFKALKSEPAK